LAIKKVDVTDISIKSDANMCSVNCDKENLILQDKYIENELILQKHQLALEKDYKRNAFLFLSS
jgi:hypothetical protein